jgi:hypothetical protein
VQRVGQMISDTLGGCIQLGFQWILKDFFMMTKSCGIQLGF